MQVPVALEDGQEKEIVFILGAAGSEEQARQLVQRFRGAANAYRALEGVWHYWSRTLGAVYVETPDPAVNFLANGWLVYQTLACRMWARTGSISPAARSASAISCRTRWPSSMPSPACCASTCSAPPAASSAKATCSTGGTRPRAAACARTSPTTISGSPTRPAAMSATTGDTGVLDERVPFLHCRPLRPDEEANYDLPQVSDDVGTLYEHCVRAIDNGLRFGSHGLPLMGCGDWNDGMNLVGQHGKGESVWLAFFLYDVLTQFVRARPPARRRRHRRQVHRSRPAGCAATSKNTAGTANGIAAPISTTARRSARPPTRNARSTRCRRAGRSCPARARAGDRLQAMESVDRRLVRRDARLIQLLDPPFDKSDLNPGYIKGYVPGVRENGGQYTHAAIWTVMAFAAMGDAKRAWELFALINPVTHGDTAEAIALYRVEPYVVAADVYAVPPHTGRGGWTWYTGSAGWMYRLITESLLGLRLEPTSCFSLLPAGGLAVVQDPLPLSRNRLSHHRPEKRPRLGRPACSGRWGSSDRPERAARRRSKRAFCGGRSELEGYTTRQPQGSTATPIRNAARNLPPASTSCGSWPLNSAFVGAVIGSSATKLFPAGAKTWA